MAIIASGLVHQNEIRERIGQIRDLFEQDPDVARLDYRVAEDWSGDDSLFIEVVLKSEAPSVTTLSRLSEAITAALLRVVRSEELGLHSYFNFVSTPTNGY